MVADSIFCAVFVVYAVSLCIMCHDHFKTYDSCERTSHLIQCVTIKMSVCVCGVSWFIINLCAKNEMAAREQWKDTTKSRKKNEAKQERAGARSPTYTYTRARTHMHAKMTKRQVYSEIYIRCTSIALFSVRTRFYWPLCYVHLMLEWRQRCWWL